MEGTLLKWTNYYNGWQPRYFILNDNGILSYYKSRELIHEGCKGSCLVLACEVKVHPHDSLRFDLIIPGEQFFSLKAKSQSERQRWIVALGTSKAIGNQSDSHSSSSSSTTTTTSKSSQGNISQSVSHLNDIDHELKLQVQQLRLYENVLMEEIHSIKTILNQSTTPDVKKLDEQTLMLNGTCDGFIQSLDQCVQLLLRNSKEDLKKKKEFFSDQSSTTKNPLKKKTVRNHLIFGRFFSQLNEKSFPFFSSESDQIRSEFFLSSAERFLQIFDQFLHSTFTQLKDQTIENIHILRRKFEIDRNNYSNLFSLIIEEINNGQSKEKFSLTLSLFRVQRILQFLCRFLLELISTDQSIEESLKKSYRQTLKEFHLWNERQLFANSFRSILSREQFLRSLVNYSSNDQQIFLEEQIYEEIIEHANNWNLLLNQINQFFTEHQIHFDQIFSP